MNVSHILLGRPWQFDTDYTYRGKTNQIILDFNGKRLVLTPLPPGPVIMDPKPAVTVVSRAELTQAITEEGFGWAITAKPIWTDVTTTIPRAVE